MDTVRGLEGVTPPNDPTEGGVGEATPVVGTDERRMHVRAYNHWVSLLKGRGYPQIADLQPEGIADFGPHSVLLDFSEGIEDPRVQYLGAALRDECGLDHAIGRISEVPARSLLSRLTDHYLQIIANKAPIGFEAEFVGTRGHTMMYRGILMPFAGPDDSIGYIYGVINWKELVDGQTQAKLDAELEAARRDVPRATVPAPVWADGPSAEYVPAALASALADQLLQARESAAAVRAADTRSRAALYRALGRAHDFALATNDDADGYARLLVEAGIAVQARAPMTPVVKLVFGADYDKTRVTEFAAVLAHAARHAVPAGGLATFIDGYDGGIKGVVQAERAVRKPAPKPRRADPIADRPSIARVGIETGAAAGEVVVLVARVAADGALDVVGAVTNDAALRDRAIRALA
ncbi:conserved hypothetical protein [Sphingomonas sp. EC-HK361]|uniref:PAS domain-containing protein n=1 Tax=Sphingomonas sp. EC-HK361 TaxID=2038397 RepID=UPI001257B278|nr:hypothetical protein [Sphingomonas sp. EC-HK361]VVT18729.1 conserved hypothetical protein [Sphingomonas sp. EC-HK361]